MSRNGTSPDSAGGAADADPAATPAARSNGRAFDATLITGGAGFIGTNLAERLLASGRRVIVYDNLSRPGVERNAEHLSKVFGALADIRVADVRDRRQLRTALAEAGEVFHFAAQVAVTTSLEQPEEDLAVNVGGTVTVLEEIRRLNRPCPLLFTSTNKVYGSLSDVPLALDSGGGAGTGTGSGGGGGERYRPVDAALAAVGVSESRPLNFSSPYGCSKGAADQYVLDYARSYHLRTCVFRMSCIYGPHQCGTEDQGWLAHFLRAAAAGRPITLYGDGRQVRDALFVDDLVNAFLLAREKSGIVTGRAFNIGGGPRNTVSLLELLDLIARLTGETPRTHHADWRTGDQRWYVSDTRAFHSATGWSASVGVEAGVARLHQWLARESMPRIALPAAKVTSR